MKLLPIVFSLLLALPAPAQQPSTAAPAQVRFTFEWNIGVPWQRYTIDVASDGKSHFEGTPHPDETNDTDEYQQDFTLSASDRQRVFDAAQKLNYFHADFDSHLKHIAHTGTKTLEYRSGETDNTTRFNWSQNPDVDALTRFFEGIATTVDCERKLAFQYRFDKLGMDKRLKELEDLQASHDVEALSILAPILHKIAGDPNLMNISRESARRLLRTIEQPQAEEQAPPAQQPAQQ
jgi:hypothetical protein